MKVTLLENKTVDLSKGIDLSLTLRGNETNPAAWYVSPPKFEPVRENGWTGAVAEGGSVNFRNIYFNPHGHGTHTECLGHITPEVYSINEHLKQFFFTAKLISVTPEHVKNEEEEDRVITYKALAAQLKENQKVEALIIRTLPNTSKKLSKNYSATNPPYISTECLPLLNKLGVRHLLIDLPSVDRESDGGALAFHHGFWEVPTNPQFDKTITELIFVPDEAEDGDYLLNLQVAPFENDAAPSRPVIFKLD